MKLFTAEISKKLLSGGYDATRPVCKLFAPWGASTWLVTGEEDGILYGYADLGMGCVEWGGLFSREEVEDIKGPMGLKIERDLYWEDDGKTDYAAMSSLSMV